MIEHADGGDPSFGGAVEDGALGTGLVAIADRSVFDVVDAIGALVEDFVFEDVEQVVEVKDAEFISGLDEGDEGPGLARFGIANEKYLGVVIGLVGGESH
jgi:hypothetical protein